MAFFDNFGKKASEVAAKTVQKTQEFAETSKLNSQIAEEEKKINSIYYQIGKLYASLHRTDCEEEFSGMVNQILEAESLIDQLRKNIQDVRKIQRCEKCGAEVPQGAGFCSACGAPMPKADSTEAGNSIRCEKCGASVKKGMRFCTSCGSPVHVENVQASVASAAKDDSISMEVTHVDALPEGSIICPNCGATMAEVLEFCTECGTKLNRGEIEQ